MFTTTKTLARPDRWRRMTPSPDRLGGVLYLPDRSGPLQVIIALHGCAQTAADFAMGSRLADWAESEGFAVLFPESDRSFQILSFNPTGCWVWWLSENQGRKGQAAQIIDLLDRAGDDYPNLQISRAPLIGLSSGAAMGAIVAAAYPDRISGFAAHSGLAFPAAFSAQDPLPGFMRAVPDQDQLAQVFAPLHFDQLAAAHRSFGDLGSVAVLHGLADGLVPVSFAEELFAQAKTAHGLNQTPETSSQRMEGLYTLQEREISGASVKLSWTGIAPLGHAWSGGSPAGSFTDMHAPSAGALFLRFFRDTGWAG